jgi:hypothetical protein
LGDSGTGESVAAMAGSTAILVLGMHRSGMSETARVLHRLGASTGASTGGRFWENTALRAVNEELLEALGGGWECPPPMTNGWTRGPATQVVTPARARSTLLAEFGNASVGVWKDPRTCLTLPFWLPVFDEPPVNVLIHRHPSEVAESLASSNGLGRAHAYAVWERFNHDALVNAAGLPTYVVGHRALLDDPVGETKQLVAALAEWGVELPNDPATTDLELRPAPRRHHAAAVDKFDDPVATDEQRELFRILRAADGASPCFALRERPPAPSPLSVEILALAAQARFARRDAMVADIALAHTTGSRRRIVRTFLERTLPDRVLPRTEVPSPTPQANRPSKPPRAG